MNRILIAMSVFAGLAYAQFRQPPPNLYFRVFAIVPYTGKGTWADPKRPMFAPLASEIGRDKSGILAYYHESTDDGKSAVVVFVAANRSALQPLLSNPAVQAFEQGKLPRAQVEQALKAVRRDFDWQRFAVRVP